MKQKVNQKEIAQRLGISKSYLSMILGRQRHPNPELADRISSLLPVNSKARLCLEGRNSTTELLPQLCKPVR